MTHQPAHLEATFEQAITEHLTANGWTEGDPADYDLTLGLNTPDLITYIKTTQPKTWTKLLAMHGSETQLTHTLGKYIAGQINTRGTISVLREGIKHSGQKITIAQFRPAHQLTASLQANYDANILTITRQLHHSETKPGDAVDLTLFINGLPVATAELKTKLTGQNVDNAIWQYRKDRNPKDLIFASRTVVHFAVDQDNVAMTTRLAGKATQFLPFNQGSHGPGQDGGKGNPSNPAGPNTAYLWTHIWSRHTWLDMFGRFIHVHTTTETNSAGKKVKKRTIVFPRYHQYDVVTKLLAISSVEGPGHNKLIQHSAGSGKSNSIAWLAHGLAQLHTPADETLLGDEAKKRGLKANQPVFDKVVIVTDRVVLDRQLQATVAGFDHTPGMIETIGKHKTSADLRKALEGKQARIIITTLQKFPVVAKAATDLAGTRFAVIADEAHSSQTGEAAKDLKKVLAGLTADAALDAAEAADSQTEAAADDLEDQIVATAKTRGKQTNLTFFAFTATPKNKTLQMFGSKTTTPDGTDVYLPFHLYSMRQAIEEGFILDVLANYTTYKTYYRLANGLTDQDPELPAGKASSALARYVSLHPTNLAQKAEIIVEHFRAKTHAKIGGHAKAMVVTRSRLHAVKYFKAIDSYIKAKGYNTGIDPVRALVAFSGTVIDPDTPGVDYREPLMNGFSEAALPEKFASDDYQVLIVAEKYQTGFDQPLLHTMYVDKPLDGIKAVQTLSRLNRTTPGKTDTFVLDFVNNIEDIQDAFKLYYTQTSAAPTDPNILYTLSWRIHEPGIIDPNELDKAVAAILEGGTRGSNKLNAAINPCIARFSELEEEDADKFRLSCREFVRNYAFLAQIMPFHDADLEKLYYYVKYLLTRLPKPDPGAAINIDSSVILTHLRTELKAENADASLTEGTDDPLPGPGDSAGAKPEIVLERLSQLIADINDRFGLSLTDADRVWVEQQEEHLASLDEVRKAAADNDIEQFGVFLRPLIDQGIITRHEANSELLKAYFDRPEFKDLMSEVLIKAVFDRLNKPTG